jgi:hypothetical protein
MSVDTSSAKEKQSERVRESAKNKKKHYLVNIPSDGSSGERVASKG